jgi:hypothetical protein
LDVGVVEFATGDQDDHPVDGLFAEQVERGRHRALACLPDRQQVDTVPLGGGSRGNSVEGVRAADAREFEEDDANAVERGPRAP